MTRFLFLFAAALTFGSALPQTLLAGSYFVRTSGNDANDGRAASRAFRTIGKAASVAIAGDTIYVGAGTYAESVSPLNDGTSSAPIRFRADTTGNLTGDAGPVTVSGGSGNGFDLVRDDYIWVYGFTIGGAAGIRVEDSAFAYIDACTIQNTTSNGIRILRSPVVINRSSLKKTGAEAVSCISGSYYLINSLIHTGTLHGVYSKTLSSTSMVYYSTIVGCAGSGIRHDGGTLYAYNSIVALNSGKGVETISGMLIHDYNLLYLNTGGDFFGVTKSTNELVADPKFNGPTDFHLKSGSPAIDAGTDIGIKDDLDGALRPNGPRPDLGCYEGVSSSSGGGSGAEYFVRITGSDSNNGRSALKAFRTIRKATSLASPGEKIYVGAGTYAEGKITFTRSGTAAKPIELIADTTGAKTGDPGSVIISRNEDLFNVDYRSYWRVIGFKLNPIGDKDAFVIDDCIGIRVENCELYGGKNAITIDDSTIAFGTCSIHDFKEDGIEVKDDSNVTLTKCIIEKCGQDGVELREGNSTVTVTESTIRLTGRCALRTETNKTRSSDLIATRCKLVDCGEDGIRLDVCSGVFENCLITDHNDDGIDISSKGSAIVRHCTVAYNGDDGIVHDRGYTDVKNSIIAFNTGDGIDLDRGNVYHSYNLVYGNTGGNFEKVTKATTEIVADPKFVSATDYHLQLGSPAQDKGAGSLNVALDGTPRPIGLAVDIGAYEGTGMNLVSLEKDYYVRVTGNDTYDGKSPATAFRTIGKAVTVVTPGDTVWVGAGSYNEVLDFSGKIGTAASPIKFVADSTGIKTLDAGTIQVRGGLYAAGAAHVNWNGFLVQVTGAKPSWTPNNAGAYIKVSSNVTLQNITVFGGDYGIIGNAATDLRLVNCVASNARNDGFAFISACTANVSNCTSSSNTAAGFYANASAVQLTGSRSDNNNARGFYFNASRGNVSNCSSLSDKLAGEFIGVNDDRTSLTVWNFKVESSRNGGLVLRHCTAQATGGTAPFSSSGTQGVYADNADVTVKDATITSAQYGIQAITGSKIELNNCSITNCLYDGVFPKGGTAVLTNCTISGCRYAVKSESNCKLTASNSTFASCTSWAIHHVGYGSISDCVVNNNYRGIYAIGAAARGDVTFNGIKIQGTTREGLMAVRCTGNLIAGTDKLSKAGSYGVYLLDSNLMLTGIEIVSSEYGVQSYGSDVELVSAKISGCKFDGIYMDDTSATVRSCTITSCRHGIWGENNSTLTADASTFSSHTSWGIQHTGFGAINNCQVNTCGKGIYLAGASTKGDVTISNTVIQGTTAEGLAAIRCTGGILAGADKLSKGGAYGVYLSDSDLQLPNVSISGAQYGIQAFNSKLTLSNAVVASCPLDGLYADKSNMTVSNCTISSCRYGIRSENNGVLNATQSTFANNTAWGIHHSGTGSVNTCLSEKNYQGFYLIGAAATGDITLTNVKIQGTTREGLYAVRCNGNVVAGTDKLSKAGDYGAYLSQSNLTFSGVQIAGPAYGVMSYSSTLNLSNASITDCPADGLYATQSTTTLSNCTIARCKNGINSENASTLTATTNTIDACTAWGLVHSGYGTITNCTINNCNQGMYLTGVNQNTDIVLANTKIQGTIKDGLIASWCSGTIIAGTTKLSNGGTYGAYLSNCDLDLTGISVSGSQQGIAAFNSIMDLADATIVGTTQSGLYTEGTTATVTNTTVSNCGTRGVDCQLNSTLNATSLVVENCGDWGVALAGLGALNNCQLIDNQKGANLVGKTARGDITFTNLVISGSADEGLNATRCRGSVQGGADSLSKGGSAGAALNDSDVTLTNANIDGSTNGIQSTLSTVTVRGVTIANASKGVFSDRDQSLVLDGVRISNCSAWGLHQLQGNSQASNCLLSNVASGLNFDTVNRARVWNSTVVANSNGISQVAGALEIKNTILSGNNANVGINRLGGTIITENNLVYGFATNFSGVTPDANTLVKNPRFTNAAAGDYTLSKGSPAINAGVDLAGYVDLDLAGNPRPAYKRWEIGAFEFLQESASLRILQWAEKK